MIVVDISDTEFTFSKFLLLIFTGDDSGLESIFSRHISDKLEVDICDIEVIFFNFTSFNVEVFFAGLLLTSDLCGLQEFLAANILADTRAALGELVSFTYFKSLFNGADECKSSSHVFIFLARAANLVLLPPESHSSTGMTGVVGLSGSSSLARDGGNGLDKSPSPKRIFIYNHQISSCDNSY